MGPKYKHLFTDKCFIRIIFNISPLKKSAITCQLFQYIHQFSIDNKILIYLTLLRSCSLDLHGVMFLCSAVFAEGL